MTRNSEDHDRPLSERRAQLKSTILRSNGSTRHSDKPRSPLIDQVNNNWYDEKSAFLADEAEKRELEFRNLHDESLCPNFTRDAVASKRFRRMVFVVVLLLGLMFWTWTWYLKPRLEEDWKIKEGFLVRENGTYGIARGGDFEGVRVQDLKTELLPGGEQDPEGKRRLVFVGDIHGCAQELKKLLKQVEFDEHTDHLVHVGDVISKGPSNVEVLEELIRLEASGVRGNHEDRLLALSPMILDTALPPRTTETSSKGSAKDAELLRQLSRHHLKYLKSLPLMLRIPALPMASKPSDKRSSPMAEDILVVHAGLVPAVSLEKQDPYFVMNMRSIYTKTHLPIVEAKARKGRSKPWHDIWGWYNDRLFRKKSLKDFRIWKSLDDVDTDTWLGKLGLSFNKKWPEPQVVVYGHHSKAGLQIGRWSKGLDTGCVSGGELTALVLNAKGESEIVSVGCKDNRA